MKHLYLFILILSIAFSAMTPAMSQAKQKVEKKVVVKETASDEKQIDV